MAPLLTQNFPNCLLSKPELGTAQFARPGETWASFDPTKQTNRAGLIRAEIPHQLACAANLIVCLNSVHVASNNEEPLMR
jgi:hypothetical protein